MTPSPGTVTAARATTAHPPAESMSPWANASRVGSSSSQKSAANGSSLAAGPV
ncbi:hypothetical protein [Actinocorallia aurea]